MSAPVSKEELETCLAEVVAQRAAIPGEPCGGTLIDCTNPGHSRYFELSCECNRLRALIYLKTLPEKGQVWRLKSHVTARVLVEDMRLVVVYYRSLDRQGNTTCSSLSTACLDTFLWWYERDVPPVPVRKPGMFASRALCSTSLWMGWLLSAALNSAFSAEVLWFKLLLCLGSLAMVMLLYSVLPKKKP